MAFYSDPQENEDELEQGQPIQTSAQSGTIEGAGGPGGAAAAPKQNAPDRGSNFVGISNYLNANKNQAGKLGDQASGVINNAANDARSSVDNLNNTFNQKVGTGVQLDQNALGKVNQAETLNDQEKNTIKSQYNAQYQGPNALSDLNDEYAQAGQKLNTAKTNVQAAGTEEGRKTLISQINAKPRTAGITNFDNALLSAGGGRQKVEQAAQANQDVTGDVLGQNNIAAQQKAADVKAQTDATRAATQQAVGGAQTALQKQFDPNDKNSKLYQAIQGALNKNNQIAQDLGDQNALDEETMAALGLQDGQQLYNLDLNNYFSQIDPNAITKEGVATQEELMRAKALADLTGGESFLADEGIGSFSQTSPLNRTALFDDIANLQKTYSPQFAEKTQSILDAQKAISDFKNNPLNASHSMERFGYDSYNNPAVEAAYKKLKQEVDSRKSGLEKWKGDVGYNRVAKKEKK